MTKKNMRYVFNLVVVIIVLFACSVGFAVLLKSNVKNGQDPVREIDVTMVSEKKNITIKNIISVSDEFGKGIQEENNGAFGYLNFDIVNHTDYDRGFEIYITEDTSTEKKLNGHYINFYLTDFTDKPVMGFTDNKLPTYYDLKILSDKADSRVLYSGIILANSKRQYTLRVWIADTYIIDNEEKEFSFTIRARAV